MANVTDFIDIFVFIGLFFLDRSSKYFKFIEHPFFICTKELALGVLEVVLLFYLPGPIGDAGLAVVVYMMKLVGNFFIWGIVGGYWLSSKTCRPDWAFGDTFDEAWEKDCCCCCCCCPCDCYGFDNQFRWFMLFWNWLLGFLGLIGTFIIVGRGDPDTGTIVLLVIGLIEMVLANIEIVYSTKKSRESKKKRIAREEAAKAEKETSPPQAMQMTP